MNSAQAPIIWLLHDDRQGHQVQLRGLGNRLVAQAKARIHWIDCKNEKTPVWRALLGMAPSLDIPEAFKSPDIIVGAGTQTHRLLASMRHKRRVHTAVLMRPSFPGSWVNSRIIPAHDNVAADHNTLITRGVLNTLTPMASLTTKHHGLILVGGPSQHFSWDGEVILQQIDRLRERYAGWRWTASSSRRTPEETIRVLKQREGATFFFRDHRETHNDWLAHTLADSRAAWITPDSVSMVYEALTAGIPTGLFELPVQSGSRVVLGIQALTEEGRAGSINEPDRIMGDHAPRPETLWEADRAACWLLERWRNSASGRKKNSP